MYQQPFSHKATVYLRNDDISTMLEHPIAFLVQKSYTHHTTLLPDEKLLVYQATDMIRHAGEYRLVLTDENVASIGTVRNDWSFTLTHSGASGQVTHNEHDGMNAVILSHGGTQIPMGEVYGEDLIPNYPGFSSEPLGQIAPRYHLAYLPSFRSQTAIAALALVVAWMQTQPVE